MDPRKMMGLTSPGDHRVPVPVRDWGAMKRALWRSRTAWEIVVREAAGILDWCAHMPGCAGEAVETEPCLPDCPGRELRMSALVILNAARQFAPIDARQPANEPYLAPSRERYSEVFAELAAAQAELEAMHTALNAVGVAVKPPPNSSSMLPERPKEPIPIHLLTKPVDEDDAEGESE
jgi:hypothetical protein